MNAWSLSEANMSVFDSFTKEHDFLICVDSDGCVMDTMNCKHFHCFGPSLTVEWGLEEWEDTILRRWTDINLLQMTRGIRRFKALAMILGEVNERYTRIPGVNTLKSWTESADALSNEMLAAAIEAENDPEGKLCLQKALNWSLTVNEEIAKLPDALRKPFTGVRAALAAAARYADIVVISGANSEAVEGEWERHGLMPYASTVYSQECGSAESCIARLISEGYAPDHVLMIGDAPEDLTTAQKAGVHFYPILVNWEEESWEAFTDEALPRFIFGQYDAYQEERSQIFIENLGG